MLNKLSFLLVLIVCPMVIFHGKELPAWEMAQEGLYNTGHNNAKKSSLPAGPGREIVEWACVTCHTTEIISNKRHTPEEWRAIVFKMVALGAPLENEHIEMVISYLADNFGPDDPYVF